MKDVWHLFKSQVGAMRWWLLVWFAVLAAWTGMRIANLTAWLEFHEANAGYYAYGLMILSALLVAAVLHLYPSAKRVAGWRAWPLRRWKVPAAQALFVLFFLVLLPGAAEMSFLFHPKLEGFMGTGVVEWLTRSLWPLPVALGLAACSQSLRRFILDALVLTGAVIAAGMVWNASWQWRTPPAPGADGSYSVHRWIIRCIPGALLLLWVALNWRKISPAKGRLFFFLTPFLLAGLLVTARFTSRPDPGYIPDISGNTGSAERINVRVIPRDGVFREDSTGKTLSTEVQVEGLGPEESADLTFWRTMVARDGAPPVFVENDWRTRGTAYFENTPWNPGAGKSVEGLPLPHVVNLGWLSTEKLLALKGSRLRLETTVMVAVQRSPEVTRLPLVKGASWQGRGMEVTIESVGPKGKLKTSQAADVLTIICRRFGREMTASRLEMDVLHKPSGFRMGTGTLDTLYWMTNRPLGVVSTRHVLTSGRNSGTWPTSGLSQWMLSHPQEFEVIVRRTEDGGRFLRRVFADSDPPRSIPGHFADTALPDVKKPESAEAFLRELELYESTEMYAGLVPLLSKCGPDILPPLEEFCLRNPNSRLTGPVTNLARELNRALFKPERPDHRLAFFKGFGHSGLFMGADPSTPEENKSLLTEGVAWVKEDPDNRLNSSWLHRMRNDAPPALYPAIRRFLEREGHTMPWRDWLHLPGLEPPPIAEPPAESVPRGPSPHAEGEFYVVSTLTLTGPQKSYAEAVRQGQPWAPRVAFVIASSHAEDNTAGFWLNVWPEVSDCPKEAGGARAWILSNADRLQFNPGTRRYELR